MSIGNSLAGLLGLGTVLPDPDLMIPRVPVSFENRSVTDFSSLKPENGYRSDCNPGYIDTLVKLNNKEFKDLLYSDLQWKCLSKEDSIKYQYNGPYPVINSMPMTKDPVKPPKIDKCPGGFVFYSGGRGGMQSECVPFGSGQRIDPDVLDKLFPVAKGSIKDKQRNMAIALSAAAIASFAIYYMYKK